MSPLVKLAAAEAKLREARHLVIEAGARPIRQRIDLTLAAIATMQKRAICKPLPGKRS